MKHVQKDCGKHWGLKPGPCGRCAAEAARKAGPPKGAAYSTASELTKVPTPLPRNVKPQNALRPEQREMLRKLRMIK